MKHVCNNISLCSWWLKSELIVITISTAIYIVIFSILIKSKLCMEKGGLKLEYIFKIVTKGGDWIWPECCKSSTYQKVLISTWLILWVMQQRSLHSAWKRGTVSSTILAYIHYLYDWLWDFNKIIDQHRIESVCSVKENTINHFDFQVWCSEWDTSARTFS